MGPNVFETHALPAAGSVTIGRDEGADVRITDPNASRNHARLHVGERLEIEDLGSANGTSVREQRIAAGQRITVLPGEGITIGWTTLMVQLRRPAFKPRRVWPHGYFEARLEEECERAAGGGGSLAVIRLRVTGGASAGVSDVLARVLRAGDLLAIYAPGEYEALLPDTERDRVRALARQIEDELAAAGIKSRVATALFPADGRTAQRLIESATVQLRGLKRPAVGERPEPILASEAMRKLYLLAKRAAGGDINVLILGETGAGKEVLADQIHQMSPRAEGPLVCINCAALAETLLESELFGHEKGAFTGAVQAKTGLLEAAKGGTVLLDEIGEMPIGVQSKLLRAIEQRQITRVGSVSARPIDVRFVAATNRDLEQEIVAKRFRQDLYFRLNGFSLTVPPLRDRIEEIEPLARHMLERSAAALKQPAPALSREARRLLEAYPWPGNIRELRNVMERAILLCDGGEITPEHLPLEKMLIAEPERGPAPTADLPADKDGQASPERQRIIEALKLCAGNQTRAANMLRMSRRTLCAKLALYNIPRPRVRGQGTVHSD
jgi:DNA-binding NtrC family response regulator